MALARSQSAPKFSIFFPLNNSTSPSKSKDCKNMSTRFSRIKTSQGLASRRQTRKASGAPEPVVILKSSPSDKCQGTPCSPPLPQTIHWEQVRTLSITPTRAANSPHWEVVTSSSRRNTSNSNQQQLKQDLPQRLLSNRHSIKMSSCKDKAR